MKINYSVRITLVCKWKRNLQKVAFGVLLFMDQKKNTYYLVISVINQLDAQNFCFTIGFISCLYMFRAHVLIIRRSKLHYTASGIVTPTGVMIPEAVEAWNKLILKQKFCAWSWLITDMHRQQNVKKNISLIY